MSGEHQDGCGHTVGTDALTNIDSTEVRKIPVEDDQVWLWISPLAPSPATWTSYVLDSGKQQLLNTGIVFNDRSGKYTIRFLHGFIHLSSLFAVQISPAE
jgi:hypothetical protein